MITKIPVHDHGYVRYVDHLGSDLRVVEAARVSYDSPSKGDEADKKLLRYLFVNHHTSPFEMCKITFEIKMPIFVMRQYIRHRMQNVNEVSARYTELPNEFFVPEKWRKQDTKNKQSSTEDSDFKPIVGLSEFPIEFTASHATKELYRRAYELYEALLDVGVAREQARMVLPVGIYTKFYATWDLNNLLKYFKLRDDPHAQGEHQDYARAMKEITKSIFPWTMEIYEVTHEQAFSKEQAG